MRDEDSSDSGGSVDSDEALGDRVVEFVASQLLPSPNALRAMELKGRASMIQQARSAPLGEERVPATAGVSWALVVMLSSNVQLPLMCSALRHHLIINAC